MSGLGVSLAGPADAPQLLRTPTKFVPIAAAVISPEVAIWTPAAGKKFRFMGIYFAEGVITGAITLKDGLAGATIFRLPALTINVGVMFLLPGNGILSAAVNNALTATGVATETLDGTIFGCEE